MTVREAARLQGFPDWFTFHPTKWHFRMIGNSVSPLLSEAILGRIRKRLELNNIDSSRKVM
ncbi:DNA cytosine methyltransferase [Aeromonas caviae]|uniref:DNA cytosine methyltransferase n=1 Tax=Aeromonas caviae TaxID=648 RepID=A0A7T4C5F1_AERCA|nr:DNA cytosine methyltransferase [Aeromonas caviae]